MKKLAILCLMAIMTLGTYAAGTSDIDSTANKLTIKVLPSKSLSCIPIQICMTNAIPMTCIQCYITSPDGQNTFLTAPDDSTSVLCSRTKRWDKDHTTIFKWNEHKHPDMLMTMLVNTKSLNFADNDGPVVEIYFDGSKLTDGDYCIRMTDPTMVWTNRKDVKAYTCPNTQANFKIKKGKLVLK